MREVVNAASWLDEGRSDVGAIIITGEGKSFAAGADVKELANVTAEEVCSDESHLYIYKKFFTKIFENLQLRL